MDQSAERSEQQSVGINDVLEDIISHYKSKGNVEVTSDLNQKAKGVTIQITEEAFIIPSPKL